MQFNYIRLVGKCALIVLAIPMLITRKKKKKKKKKKFKKEELVKNVYFHFRYSLAV